MADARPLEDLSSLSPESLLSLPNGGWGLPPAHADSTDFRFHTKPFAHQLRDFLRSRDMPEFAVFWEQGTGKSKLIIDTAAWLWAQGKIDAVVVVAPNSVHRNWIADQIPEHLTEELRAVSRMHVYQSTRAPTKWHQQAVRELLGHRGLSWMAISYNAFMTKRGKQTMWRLLKSRRVLYVLDESARIKTPSAKRTISIVASGVYAPYKRIMTGTPVANGPFDIYAPLRFLRDKFWKRHSIGSALAFRHEFGVYQQGYDGRSDREYKALVGYKNLERLHKMLQPISSRVTKDEVLDLPPKLYSRRYFQLSREQERLYAELREHFIAELESGDLVKAPMVLVRMLRFQQITCGYLPTEDEDESQVFHMINAENPRLELLREVCEDTPHQAIIWARFTKDVDLIMDMLGDRAVRFDGQVREEDREANKQTFLKGDAQFFVAKASVGGEGLTLNCARTVIYYNNTFSLTERLQSEDRAHRIGQEHPVQYIDLLAEDTIDERIVDALRKKMNIAAKITGDELRQWL